LAHLVMPRVYHIREATRRDNSNVVSQLPLHWAVAVEGVGRVESGRNSETGRNAAKFNTKAWRGVLVGSTTRCTQKGHLEALAEEWNSRWGGSRAYDPANNSCQHFATWVLKKMGIPDKDIPSEMLKGWMSAKAGCGEASATLVEGTAVDFKAGGLVGVQAVGLKVGAKAAVDRGVQAGYDAEFKVVGAEVGPVGAAVALDGGSQAIASAKEGVALKVVGFGGGITAKDGAFLSTPIGKVNLKWW